MSKHTCLSLSSRFRSRTPVMAPFSLNLSQQTVILFCRSPVLSCMLAEWCWLATILMPCSLSRKRFLYFILFDFTAANWSVSLLIIACVFFGRVHFDIFIFALLFDHSFSLIFCCATLIVRWNVANISHVITHHYLYVCLSVSLLLDKRLVCFFHLSYRSFVRSCLKRRFLGARAFIGHWSV